MESSAYRLHSRKDKTEESMPIGTEEQSTRENLAVPQGDFAERVSAPSSDRLNPASTTIPRHIAGGFAAVADELDRRSRDWTMMVRLLDQQRLHLQTSETERDRLHIELEGMLPNMREAARALQSAIDATKSGDISANLSSLFAENLRSLDALENVARALTANLLWTRSSWEQYARSVIGAQKMREEIKTG